MTVPVDASGEVRWTTSDRGLRYYVVPDGHVLHESSNAAAPHLWVDEEQMTVEDTAALRDRQAPGLWRDALTVAIEDHYQTRESDPGSWKAGDPCLICGSTDTALEDDVAGCRGCGVWEDGR